MELVSIVIPVHNTAPFVGDALASIRAQTHARLEILCIDDASTDESLSVLRAHAAEDERIQLIALPENIGLGAVRNHGLERATGDWVYFFDSDDLLDRDGIAVLVERASQDSLDALLFDAAPFSDDLGEEVLEAHRRYYTRKSEYAGVWSGRDLFQAMAAADDWKPSMCLRFLRRSWLIAADIRSPEGVLHEDQLHAFRIAMADSRTGYLARALFHRRLRGGSITTSAPSAAHVLGLSQACAEARAIADGLGVHTDSALGAAIRFEMGKTHDDAVHKFARLTEHERRALAAAKPQTMAMAAELALIHAQVQSAALSGEAAARAAEAAAERLRLEDELSQARSRIAEYAQHPLRRVARRVRATLGSRPR